MIGTLKQIIDCLDRHDFKKYIEGLMCNHSFDAYLFFFSLFAIIAFVLLVWKGNKNGILKAGWMFFMSYVCLILCITIVFRNSSERKPIELELFWSYNRILRRNSYLLYENIVNVIMFFPIGFLLGYLLPLSRWWATLLIGIVLSASIELLQLGFHRGLCELEGLSFHTNKTVF